MILSDNCRQQFLLQDGHLLLMKLLRQCLHLEGQMQFKTIVSGCLLNFSCQNGKSFYFFCILAHS